MPKQLDIMRKRFGRLTVLYLYNEVKICPNGSTRSLYVCLCDCGKEFIAQGVLIKRGKVQSCGCYKSELTRARNTKDSKNLVGKVFGRLTVIERGDDYINPDGTHRSQWVCKCQCGRTALVLQMNLVGNKVSSCGCLKESKIAIGLKEYFSKYYNAISEYKIIKNPDNGYWLPYDLYIPDNIFVEVHGLHHYQRSEFFQKNGEFEHRQYLDKVKRKFARQSGKYIEIDLRKIKTIEDAINYIEKQI